MVEFDFSDLIHQYSTSFTVQIPSTGHYDDSGDWVKGELTQATMQGAIIAHRENKIFRSQGTITENDRALYMLEPLEFALQGAFIIHQGNKYSIDSRLDNAVLTGVYAYTLKWVSAFNEVNV